MLKNIFKTKVTVVVPIVDNRGQPSLLKYTLQKH